MNIAVQIQFDGSEERDSTLHDRAEGDEVFAGLVSRQSRLMFRVAYGVLRNAHDAEDAVQESFMKLYRGQAWWEIRDESAFMARTVYREALNRLSARPDKTDDIAEHDLLSTTRSPEESVTREDEAQLLKQLIGKLPEDLRGVLVLSALEEMNSREIGLVLNIPEATVRTRLMRARAELKKRFEAMKGARA